MKAKIGLVKLPQIKLDESLADAFSKFLRDGRIPTKRINFIPLDEHNPFTDETIFEVELTVWSTDQPVVEAELERLRIMQNNRTVANPEDGG